MDGVLGLIPAAEQAHGKCQHAAGLKVIEATKGGFITERTGLYGTGVVKVVRVLRTDGCRVCWHRGPDSIGWESIIQLTVVAP
ncbi:hypothetical protein HHA02_21340 [Cobetia marina]|nr:hypothetical protein HHA02_21340 [Cobetia marina]